MKCVKSRISGQEDCREKRPPVMIAIWIPKGGVGKTTTSFTLAYNMAKSGYKVLAVDTDSQRDLSHLFLKNRYGADTKFREDYMRYITRPSVEGGSPIRRTLHEMLIGLNSSPYALSDASPEEFFAEEVGSGSLHLLCGHRDMDMWDSEIAAAELTMSQFPGNKDKPGAPYHAVYNVAKKIGADIIIVDLPPSKGALTRNLLMSSDYFLIPTKPEYFSYEAVVSLFDRLVGEDGHGDGVIGQEARHGPWIEYTKNYLVRGTADSPYKFPDKTPKFLGYVISDYEVNGPACSAIMSQNVASDDVTPHCQQWMTQIHCAVKYGASKLIKATLSDNKAVPMAIADTAYDNLGIRRLLLGKFHSFDVLQTCSHCAGIPATHLDEEHFFTRGTILPSVSPVVGVSNERTLSCSLRGRDYATAAASTGSAASTTKRKKEVLALKKFYESTVCAITSLIHADTPDGRIGFRDHPYDCDYDNDKYDSQQYTNGRVNDDSSQCLHRIVQQERPPKKKMKTLSSSSSSSAAAADATGSTATATGSSTSTAASHNDYDVDDVIDTGAQHTPSTQTRPSCKRKKERATPSIERSAPQPINQSYDTPGY